MCRDLQMRAVRVVLDKDLNFLEGDIYDSQTKIHWIVNSIKSMGNNEGKSLEAADSNKHKNNVDHQYKQIFYDLIIERILEKLDSKPKFGNLMRKPTMAEKLVQFVFNKPRLGEMTEIYSHATLKYFISDKNVQII